MHDTPSNAGFTASPGEAAAHYDEFFGSRYFEPYAIEVARRIDPATAAVVLEIAAGTGRVTRHIRERILPGATLIASDIDENMLAVAKKKLSHLAIDWRNIDAGELPFGNNSIDLVVCCFGYMFVPDRQKAFAEACRVLKPGGVLLYTTWDKLENNGASFLSRSISEGYLEQPLPESSNLATSMCDKAVLTALTRDAGFAEVSIEFVSLSFVSETAKEAAQGLLQGGAAFEQMGRQDPALINQVITRVEKGLAEKFGAAPMVAPMSALICRARK